MEHRHRKHETLEGGIVKVGDVVNAKWRSNGGFRGDQHALDGGVEYPSGSVGPGAPLRWLGVVHAVRGVGHGKKARRRRYEVDVLWEDGVLTTEVTIIGSHLEVLG